ncbi:cob(I)yrinic acid a,c-diamide adenosyltransferase [Hydrogenovibrio sp. 3SP14C1]|uniref:cob(I)yrinic acid a,c-diamide adenosyltransferase n=1 Tax=Hydrogenovibrio sp. 3SP14C1 TaxID=3038774 RepID=UPI002416E2CD|nr:cob(I)yrinic acid a,c-diamide adenosyltransferase [Hydrogenovibrio sp. 3SP14C1]MDG4812998.1 cob(I)yrinic acid a,c-diamide adenosyltransferase [Hydrogenovibrio sp. 3SP14C1]
MASQVDPLAEKHNKIMKRRKAFMDHKIQIATDSKGILLVNTGDGKGKSSSAFGMVVRALGHDMKVAVVQFIKGAMETGEERFFKRFPDEIVFKAMGEGFTWDTQDRTRDIEICELAWAQAKSFLQDDSIDLVVLDELNVALSFQYLDFDVIRQDIETRCPGQHLIITGRGAPDALVDMADTVTEMTLVKHAFDKGVQAQLGIEL